MAPLILVLISSTIMVTVATRYGDDTVSDTYYKDSRMYHFSADQDERAKALGLAAVVQFDPVESLVHLDLRGDIDYPEKLMLVMGHPVEADLDQYVILELLAPGRYRGSAVGELKHRRYLQLSPEIDPEKIQDAEWRLKGEINFDLGNGVPLNPAQQ